MRAYGRDIQEVMAWTYPQLRMMRRYREMRMRDERRWELILGSGTLNPEMFDQLWQGLGGKKIGLKSQTTTEPTRQPTKIGQQSHGVDAKGNVVAPGAPLLSDIALGKAVPPQLIPITVIDKGAKENDGAERPDATPAGD